jgi:hypothetical protein
VEDGPFSISNDDLRRLDDGEAIKLVSELLWAEATRLGIPISKVHISAETNIPDEGVDAKIAEANISADLIRPGHTVY